MPQSLLLRSTLFDPLWIVTLTGDRSSMLCALDEVCCAAAWVTWARFAEEATKSSLASECGLSEAGLSDERIRGIAKAAVMRYAK